MAWDLFVSYSGAQRDFVAPLARSLNEDHGLAVWLDQWRLSPGDALAAKISDGIRRSRAALVVLSRSFLASRWPADELAQIVAQHRNSIILALYDLTPRDLEDFSPTLAGVLHIAASGRDVQDVATEIASAMKGLLREPGTLDLDDEQRELLRVTRRARTSTVRGLSHALAQRFDDGREAWQLVTEAMHLIKDTIAGADGPPPVYLPRAYVSFQGAPLEVWANVLDQAEMVGPRAQMALMLRVRSRGPEHAQVNQMIERLLQPR